jgi:hypothetical protein
MRAALRPELESSVEALWAGASEQRPIEGPGTVEVRA